MDYEEERIKLPRIKEESGFYTTEKHAKIRSISRGKNTKAALL